MPKIQFRCTVIVLGQKGSVPSGGDQNDGEWFERADHPLLNDLVLTKIFDNLRGNDLKRCRLVNKNWTISTLPFSSSRLQVTISGSDPENPKGIENFMKLMNTNTLGIPFGRFELGSFDTTQGFGQQFVQLFGNTTKELILMDTTNDYKVESISELLQSMPRLESFTIPRRISSKDDGVVELFPGTKPKLSFLKFLIIEDEKAEENRKICPTLYEELLGAAPNISTLELLASHSHDTTDNDTAIEVLETLEKLGRGSSIQNLTLRPLNELILALLRKMASKGMKLKKLNFLEREPVQNITNWLELVTLFKDCLISLGIGIQTYSRIDLIFPAMPKLIKLNLMTSGNTNLSCENFTQTFPALQELYICIERFHVNNFTNGDKSQTMKSLTLRYRPKMNMEMLNRILSLFPALTMLDCDVREEDGVQVIKQIWTHMTQLRGLRIRGTLPSSVNENVDSLVTGIPAQDINNKPWIHFLEKLRAAAPKWHRENILKRMMKRTRLEVPSIRNLTNLRSLSLDLTTSGSENVRQFYLTDLTAYFGLYSIKTLRHLYVSHCQFCHCSCKILVKDMELMTWSFGAQSTNVHLIPPRVNPNDEYVYQ